jgi:hypothetical protein
MSAPGSKADLTAPKSNFRFTPQSGHRTMSVSCQYRKSQTLFDHHDIKRGRQIGGLNDCEKRIVTAGHHRRQSREMLRICRRSFDVQFALGQLARLGFFPGFPKLAR